MATAIKRQLLNFGLVLVIGTMVIVFAVMLLTTGSPSDSTLSSEICGSLPLPDFKKVVNYKGWVKRKLSINEKDNAYAFYSTFFQKEGDVVPDYLRPEGDAAMQLRSLLEKPQPWENTNNVKLSKYLLEIQPYLNNYKQGANCKAFSYPIDETGTLLEMVIPHVGNSKVLSEACIAQAWKAEPDFQGSEFVDNIILVLKHSNHIRQNLTLMENITSNRARMLVYDSILTMIEQDLLSFEDFQHLRSFLESDDYIDLREPFCRSLLFEKAASLDLLQDICKPFRIIGSPRLNHERVDYWLRLFSKTLEESVQRKLLSEDPRSIVKVIDSYYDEVSVLLSNEYNNNLLTTYELLYKKYQSKHLYFESFPLTDFWKPYQECLQVVRKRCLVHTALNLTNK